ncbi:MAG: hypothetical protein LC121_23545 [Anaerolineae bacterium]|nr:hypothetical protein [Anaerolineae bacterium]
MEALIAVINKAYALRWRYRALPYYPRMRWLTSGSSERPRWGFFRYSIHLRDDFRSWFYWRAGVSLGLFSVYADAGWKLQGFLEGARPGADDKVSTGNFLGIGLRTDDFGDA